VSETIKTTIKPPGSREVWIACSLCAMVTCHQPLSLVETHDVSEDESIQVWDEYYIVQCRGCRNVSFCIKSSCTENAIYNPRTGESELEVRTRVYPSRIAGRPGLDHVYLLPYPVNTVYTETRMALANDQPVLGGIGIRAIVETVCKDQSANGKDLMERIDDLARKGVVTPDGAKILHGLRFMGNDAAHEVKAHPEADLMTALDVVEYLLKGVYILPRLAEKLPKK